MDETPEALEFWSEHGAEAAFLQAAGSDQQICLVAGVRLPRLLPAPTLAAGMTRGHLGAHHDSAAA